MRWVIFAMLLGFLSCSSDEPEAPDPVAPSPHKWSAPVTVSDPAAIEVRRAHFFDQAGCPEDCVRLDYQDPRGSRHVFFVTRSAGCSFPLSDIESKSVDCTDTGPFIRLWLTQDALARLAQCTRPHIENTPILVTVNGQAAGITGYYAKHLTVSPGPTSSLIADFVRPVPEKGGIKPGCQW